MYEYYDKTVSNSYRRKLNLGFFLEIYDREHRTGVAVPFFEYAITSSWFDTANIYLNRIWFDGDKIVAFVFYEKLGYGSGNTFYIWKK